MANLFQKLEAAAARGAEGLLPEARETLAKALLALQQASGGFAGLDGRADPYFTFFAWLSLRALGAGYDRDRLCAYMQAHRRDAKTVDAQCARILLAAEGEGMRLSWLKLPAALLRGDTREAYAAFMLALAGGAAPRWAARLAWWRQRSLFRAGRVERLPTPRLAAGLVLAGLAGVRGSEIASALLSRRRASGGFASADGAPADLLATAVARFAAGQASGGGLQQDLAFVEACWLEDGLFGPSPAARQGDAEHTFYGLLAFGTCR